MKNRKKIVLTANQRCRYHTESLLLRFFEVDFSNLFLTLIKWDDPLRKTRKRCRNLICTIFKSFLTVTFRCIRKMDHHCPWVNNCVGENNQKYFVLFTVSKQAKRASCIHRCFANVKNIYTPLIITVLYCRDISAILVFMHTTVHYLC